jgi:hypothetical protein
MYVRTFGMIYQELRRTRTLMGNYERKQLAKKLYSEQYAPHLRATIIEHL